MNKPKIVLSLREFAKRSGISPNGVKYHIDRGHIKVTVREVLGISEDQLEVLKKYSKESKKTVS